MLHLVGPADGDVNRLAARLQLFDRLFQRLDRHRDPFRHPEVDKDKEEDEEEHDKNAEQTQLDMVGSEAFGRDDADQLPAGVAHRFDGDLAGLPAEFLAVDSILIACRRAVVLPQQAGIDKLLARVVDDLAVPVDQVEIPAFAEIDVLADLFDASEVHIHQQHPALDRSRTGQLNLPGKRDDPAVEIVRVLKEVLHMRG